MREAGTFDHETKLPGKRNGPLGASGLEVLRCLWRLRGRKDGRLDPTYQCAKAELVETYPDMDLTGAGQRQVDDMEPSIVELRRDALHAVRNMLGRTRLRVELI